MEQHYNILSLKHNKLQSSLFMNIITNDSQISVIIDLTPLRGEKTGIGNYIHYTLKHLLSNYNDLLITGLSFGFHKFQEDSLEIIQQIKRHIHYPLPVRILYKWWKYISKPKIDFLIKDVSLFHFTNYYLPPINKSKKTVLTIYDLSFLTHPQWVSPKIIHLFKPTIFNSAQKATHIITCSEKSKTDISTILNIPPEKVTVSYPGIDKSIFHPVDKEESHHYLKKNYSIKLPYILFVGTIEERKNITGLLTIYEKIHKQIPHHLVLIGKKGYQSEKILSQIQTMESSHKILYLDYIKNHTELKWFYNSADLLIFPSFDEGFGIPPLEAMACGCPTIVSNQGALPEVVGPDGIAIHPQDFDQFSTTIINILSDKELHNNLKQRSIKQAEKFDWAITARTHYEVYKKLESI